MDAETAQDIDLLLSCHAASCAGKLISGSVHHLILSEDQIAAGYVLTGVATPTLGHTVDSYGK